jgi:tRNA threonylcarbamoyladenosine biosynthesis protein TsaB
MESLNILTIDTSSRILKIGISFEGKDYYKDIDEGYRHVENIFPVMEKLFEEFGIKKDKVEYAGVCTGPGSFTGIRIGIASISAVSYSLNNKCFGFSAFDIYKYLFKDHGNCIVIPIIDGKKQKFYCAFIEEDKPIVMHDLSLMEIMNKIKELEKSNKEIIFAGSDFKLIKNNFDAKYKHDYESDFNALDMLNFSKSLISNNAELIYPKPIYLRKSEAEINLKQK